MSDANSFHRACEVLYREARCLDEQRWLDWLSLFHDDAVFWVPTWKEDGEPASDPETELSLIYCNSRNQLRERVERVMGGRSVASLPLPRTVHTVGNVMMAEGSGGVLHMQSVVTTHVFNIKTREQSVFFCLQEHDLAPDDSGALVIRRKKLLLQNDYIPRMIDFYTI